MSNVVSPLNYIVKKDDKFFFDANVWLYILGNLGGARRGIVEAYSNLYNEILESEAKIYTNSLLISEFINTYSRIEFKYEQKTDPRIKDFKRDYRDNDNYKDKFSFLYKLTKNKILDKTIQISDCFEEFSTNSLITHEISYDYNDYYYTFLAEKQGLKIVTNDKDFLKYKDTVTIISLHIN